MIEPAPTASSGWDDRGHNIPIPTNWLVMHELDVSDEQLLSARDAASFELFYRRHVEPVLGFFARRTRDPELAADLCAETFAAALAGRHRYRPEAGAAAAWLYGIGSKKLADAQRRGYAERRARRRLGMERIELADDDFARIERLGEAGEARVLMDRLAPDQRDAITRHVLDERPYEQIATELETSEAVVRKRVSRGLAAMRQRMGVRR
jgi:RNA polymerase sigma-70 factor (ECF subfamily)